MLLKHIPVRHCPNTLLIAPPGASARAVAVSTTPAFSDEPWQILIPRKSESLSAARPVAARPFARAADRQLLERVF
jgi:hypothetical protein